MDELVKKIETTYDELIYTIGKVNQLSDTIENLKITTTQIIDRYTETLDLTKIEKVRQTTEKSLQAMVEDVKKIENLMGNLEISKQNVADLMSLFTNRMATLEDTLKKTRNPIQEIDQKLIKYIKEAEKNAELGMKRFTQAAQLVDAKEEIKKYDELIALQKENNKLIKQLMTKLTVNSYDEKPLLNNVNPKLDAFVAPKVKKDNNILDNIKK
ncbi:hypothetical protein KTG15_12855 [Methanobacterium sp. YSL]|nr:hypothetical protein [Methanobacterium sp. YSL]